MASKRSRGMVWFVLGLSALCAAAFARHLVDLLSAEEIDVAACGLVIFRMPIELLATSYFFLYIFIAAAHLLTRDAHPREAASSTVPVGDPPPVGIIYLCCGDLDRAALESLARLEYRGKRYLVVHDDSTAPDAQAEVDAAVAQLRRWSSWEILLLRRPTKEGGKSGAVNYVLDTGAPLFDYFLLCDNDSVALDPAAIEKAMTYFASDPTLAVMQCRLVGVDDPDQPRLMRLLSGSIDAFHAFMRLYDRFGWRPFVGHNALLKTRPVLEVGKLTPGFFSDDLDLTLRLNVAGHQVAYAPDIAFAETMPPSYAALRKRTYKWAYGCMQVLKAHGLTVLTTPRLSLAEKLSFFQFTGNYLFQGLLLLYLIGMFLVAPFFTQVHHLTPTTALLLGTMMIVVLYLPVMSHFLKLRRPLDGLACVTAAALVYGTMDFCSTRATLDCLLNRRRQWIPTNTVRRAGTLHLQAEAFFGFLLIAVPLWLFPPLLYLPSSYLFAGKFMLGPTIDLIYDGRRRTRSDERVRGAQEDEAPATSAPASAAAALIMALAVSLLLPLLAPRAAHAADVQIQGKQLHVDGKPFLVKGIYYGPWRPGTGPNKNYPFPSAELIDQDLALIRKLNANAIVIYDPPPHVFDVAEKHGLKVMYTFTINFYDFGTDQFPALKQRMLDRVAEVKDKPALIGWILGNEIPISAIDNLGPPTLEKGLAELYHAVKGVDPKHPVTHSGWPPSKELSLGFFDIASFNLYPLWPPEVVAQGYGNYITDNLQPIAGDRPLLITEFGVNRIEAKEAGQARLLKQCWQDLRAANTCGGVVFEFADQWWKNYDNSLRPGQWWYRVPAPDDEQQHDIDPEEPYGIMTAQRTPYDAYAAVAQMFADDPAVASAAARGRYSRAIPAVTAGSLIILAAAAWIWSRRHVGRDGAREA